MEKAQQLAADGQARYIRSELMRSKGGFKKANKRQELY